MLIYSMGVSVDGFIADREGAFGWSVPNEEQQPPLDESGDALPSGRRHNLLA